MLTLVEIGGSGRTALLNTGLMMIGADQENDLVLQDPQSDKFQARIMHRDDKYWLEDLNSLSGTYLNETRVGSCVIPANAMLRIGGSQWRCVFGDAPAPPEGGHQVTHALSEEGPPPPKYLAPPRTARPRLPKIEYDHSPAWGYTILAMLTCATIALYLISRADVIQGVFTQYAFNPLEVSDTSLLRTIPIGYVFTLPFIFFAIRRLLWNTLTHYSITDEDIVTHTGILARQEKHEKTSKFHDIVVKRNFLELFEGSGTVILRSQLGDYLALRGIRNVKQTSDAIRPYLSPPTASILGQMLPGAQFNQRIAGPRKEGGCGCLLLMAFVFLAPAVLPTLMKFPFMHQLIHMIRQAFKV
jgi:hypothetical protein